MFNILSLKGVYNMKKFKLKAGILAFVMCFNTGIFNTYADNVRDSEMLYHEISYEDELKEAYDNTDLGDLSSVTDNLMLPLSYGIHVSIRWESSDEKIVSADGEITNPSDKDGDKKVTLTATFTSNKTDKSLQKDFEITVKSLSTEEILKKEAAMTASYIDYILNDGYLLPDKKDIGITSDISWSVSEGEASITEDNTLVKTDKSSEREPVKLQAVLTNEGVSQTVDIDNIILLDKYAGYIMSFFGGNDDKKTVHLAYSYDGEHFFALNDGNTILKTKQSIKYQELRDPFIMRKKDGSFAVLATNSWRSTSIYLWDSENLTSFDNERTAVLSVKDVVGLSGFHTWAPECNYDRGTDTYTVYWSDPEADNNNGKTYYNTSSDLKTFSQPGILYSIEGTMIDASIKKYNGYYYMVYNDAYGDNDTGLGGKIIYMAKSASLTPGSFRQISGALSPAGTVSEGPFLFQNFKDKSWYVFYDHYSLHKFGSVKTSDITSDNWDYLGVSTTMPTENIRHGGVIAVTEKELNAIIDTYRKSEPVLSQIVTPDEITVFKDSKDYSLPKHISVILSDGQTVSKNVKWNESDINTSTEGRIVIKGEVSVDDAGEATNVSLTINVIKKPENNMITVIVIISVAVILTASISAIIIKRKKQE